MNDIRLERLLDAVLADIAAEHVPGRLGRDIALATSRVRQRRRWLALIKEPPMRLPSGLAVGSPTFRLASIMVVTFALVLAAAGAVAVGASLMPTTEPGPTPDVPPAPAILTWHRLPDDPMFVDGTADVTGIAALANGSIVAVSQRDPSVSAQEPGLESNLASWVLRPGATAWDSVGFPSLDGPDFRGDRIVSMVQGRAGLVAVSEDRVWSSADGLAWTPTKVPHAYMLDVIATDAGYAAVDPAVGAPALWTSADGLRWQATNLGSVGAGASANVVAHSPELGYLMGGPGEGRPVLWTSLGGESWTRVNLPLGATKDHLWWIRDLAAGPTGFLTLIEDRSDQAHGRTSVWFSPDGQAWHKVAEHAGAMSKLAAVGDGFVAVGPGTVMASPDGVHWTTTPEPLFDGYLMHALTVASDGRVVTGGSTDSRDSQAAVWVGTPGAAGAPSSPAAGG